LTVWYFEFSIANGFSALRAFFLYMPACYSGIKTFSFALKLLAISRLKNPKHSVIEIAFSPKKA